VNLTEDDYLEHYGILRKSGRYPWGSGGSESTRNRSFLDTVENLRKQGMTDTEIARGFSTPEHPFTTSDLRAAKTIALNQQKQERINQVQKLADKGYSNVAIGQRLGINESSVRALRAPGEKDKVNLLTSTADMLKRQVEEKKYLDVGRGVELDLPLSDGGNIGISPDKFKTAIAMLKEEGYKVHYLKVQQLGTGKDTTVKVLTKPDVPYSEVSKNRGQVKLISEFSQTHGRSWDAINPPTSISSRRLGINYAEDGGAKNDGVIYIRPGVKNLELGKANYAQVRIAVDGTHYLKGMAVYKDDLPEGVDLVFNTNKSNTGRKKDVLKEMEKNADGSINMDNPFGATIKPGGQRGHLNVVNEEGDWDNWSRTLSSQVLSKQSPALAKQQLNMTHERRQTEFDDITNLTNPSVRKKLLESFADETDSAAVHLKAAALPGQATKVILPVNSIKEREIYAPTFKDGTRVALIRFPHGGTFEIPELTVNNRNPEAKKILGSSAKDAVGIHHKVAEHLSGADFDGDHVLVIPNIKGTIKSTPALEGLKGFDPQHYKIPPGSNIPKITPARKQQEMGKVSNLITDMTIQGAGSEDLARAIRHSMVVIDSEKHGLDFKASAKDNGILDLKEKYQGSKKSGASTLISRAGSDKFVNELKPRPASEGGPVDPVTGKKVFVPTGRTYVNKKGQTVANKSRFDRLALEADAHALSSGTRIESVYADHSNQLKSLANQARKEALTTKLTPYSKSAKAVYSNEVASLNAKLNIAKKNAPLERQAQALANQVVSQKRQANPNMAASDLKKIKNQALTESRIRINAKKQRIEITQSEWNAIQAGAISNSKLDEILTHSDLDVVKQLATPRVDKLMTSTKTLRAQSMLSSGYTQAEVAAALGVSLTTLKTGING
jgi:DNA-binding CsgD family transcriptional regulator